MRRDPLRPLKEVALDIVWGFAGAIGSIFSATMAILGTEP